MSSPPSGMPAIPPDIAMITGPTMVGIVLNWGFMGVLMVQLYYYFENFSDDRRAIKALVYGLALLDITQTVLITADAFHWFVYGFGDMRRLDETFLNSWDVPVIDSVISLVVQMFYIWRIHFLRKTYLIPVLILMAHELGHLSLISTEVVPQTIWLVGAAVADVAIAIVLSWALLYQRNATLPASVTHSVISRIIRLVVETNALTAGVAVIALILFWAAPHHPTLVVPPTAIIGKLYSNCLIALFNNRLKETAMRKGSSHGMQSVHLPNSSHRSRHDDNNPNVLKVHIVREMDTSYDEEGRNVELGDLALQKSTQIRR
ncbi:hypothetical protein R3P38DRAFT_3356061 [Favolaschia claudopus]|uniref:DUF6534 domain-containing protein n=1 Tax=Favolaschia claudopus TaxID=2862362 RepID=A0AAW0BDF5_9AGAR